MRQPGDPNRPEQTSHSLPSCETGFLNLARLAVFLPRHSFNSRTRNFLPGFPKKIDCFQKLLTLTDLRKEKQLERLSS